MKPIGLLFAFGIVAAQATEIVTCSITDQSNTVVSQLCVDPAGRWRAQAYGPHLDVSKDGWDVRAGSLLQVGPVAPGYTVTISGSWQETAEYVFSMNDYPDGTPGALQYSQTYSVDNEHDGDTLAILASGGSRSLTAPGCTPVSPVLASGLLCDVYFTYGDPVVLTASVNVQASLTATAAFQRYGADEISAHFVRELPGDPPVATAEAPEPGSWWMAAFGLLSLYALNKRRKAMTFSPVYVASRRGCAKWTGPNEG